VILNNYCIHSNGLTNLALQQTEDRIVLHFLPRYYQQGNKIERVWEDVHSHATRNHICVDMKALMHEVQG